MINANTDNGTTQQNASNVKRAQPKKSCITEQQNANITPNTSETQTPKQLVDVTHSQIQQQQANTQAIH